MMKQHKTAIVVAFFLFAIIILSALNLFFLLENITTREDRVRQSVEKVLEEVKQGNIAAPTVTLPTIPPNKEIQYIKGADGQRGLDGVSIKGDKGDKGEPGLSIKGNKGDTGEPGLTPELRCNNIRNRWEVRYSFKDKWQAMNGENIKCTYDVVDNNISQEE